MHDDTTRDGTTRDDAQTSPEFDSVIRRVQQQLTSRRGFLAGSAAAGAGALGLASGLASADHEGNGNGDDNSGMSGGNPYSQEGTDVDVLNYALTLEHLEDAFYREATLSRETVTSADALAGFSEEFREQVYDNIQLIGEHESTHVDVLTQVIRTLGGEPVQAAEYDFGIPRNEEMGPAKYLATAQALENTGVMAYAGALDLIESPDLQTAAGTVATVEARHASYLNLLNGGTPFPDAFDEAKPMDEILEVAGQFIVE
jgi:rubrerythrin